MDANSPEDLEGLETATFAEGCFWCMEAGFEEALGVVEAVSGYTGGHTETPPSPCMVSRNPFLMSMPS